MRFVSVLPRITLSVVVAVLLLLSLPGNAKAYTDPGSGILLWQSIAAILLSLLFYLHRFKVWLFTLIKRRRGKIS